MNIEDLLDTKLNYHSKDRFLFLLNLVEDKYSKSKFRLAGEGWEYPWQTLLVTILSAQSKDELTIVVSEKLFENYPTLESLAEANYDDVLNILSSMNYIGLKLNILSYQLNCYLKILKGLHLKQLMN